MNWSPWLQIQEICIQDSGSVIRLTSQSSPVMLHVHISGVPQVLTFGAFGVGVAFSERNEATTLKQNLVDSDSALDCAE